MLRNAALDAQVSGKLPLILLLFSARIVSLGKALFSPHAGGNVPLIWFPVSVSSLCTDTRLNSGLDQAAQTAQTKWDICWSQAGGHGLTRGWQSPGTRRRAGCR